MLSETILIVDDTPLNIEVLGETLADEYNVIFAVNGKEALEMAKEHLPDLILLDIMMPEMDGYEVCRHAKADPTLKSIPIIFITALNQELEETRGLELGAVDYITKPIRPSIVQTRVRGWIERRRIEKEREKLIEDLRNALAEVQRLSRLLPICAWCKKIRDDQGYWTQVESYLAEHTDLVFSHCICPDCLKKLEEEHSDMDAR